MRGAQIIGHPDPGAGPGAAPTMATGVEATLRFMAAVRLGDADADLEASTLEDGTLAFTDTASGRWVAVRLVGAGETEKAVMESLGALSDAMDPPAHTLVVLPAGAHGYTKLRARRHELGVFEEEALRYIACAHEDVPGARVLRAEEEAALLRSMQLGSSAQLPRMRRDDAQARLMGWQPGSVVAFARSTDSGPVTFYRVIK